MKKNIIIIGAFIFVISLFIGLSNPLALTNIVAIKISYKFFLINTLLYIIAFGLSYLGIPFYYFLLLYEIIASGVVSASLIVSFSLMGVILSIIIIAIKLIIWFLLFLNGFYSLKLIKNNYKYFFRRYRINRENSKIYLKKMLIISTFLIIINILFIPLNKKIIILFTKYFLFKLS